MRFALVHSPAVGPSTWRWVADRLRSAGHEVIVPNLVDAARGGDPLEFVAGVVQAVDAGQPLVLAGHSGAGPLLPAITDGLAPHVRLTVWVDAGLPPCEGTFCVAGDFVATLRGLARGGVLPVWSQWFGEGVLERLVHDALRRQAIEDELPQVPLAFYEASIAAPRDWCTKGNAYVLLSENYRSDASTAASLAWPVVERLGEGHLAIANDEGTIADALVALAAGRSGA